MINRQEILVFPDNDRLSKIFPAFSLGFSFNEKMVSVYGLFVVNGYKFHRKQSFHFAYRKWKARKSRFLRIF